MSNLFLKNIYYIYTYHMLVEFVSLLYYHLVNQLFSDLFPEFERISDVELVYYPCYIKLL